MIIVVCSFKVPFRETNSNIIKHTFFVIQMVDWLIVYFISHATFMKNTKHKWRKNMLSCVLWFFISVVNINSLIEPGASEILSLCLSIFEIVLISVRIYWNNISNFYQKNEFIRIMVTKVKRTWKSILKLHFPFVSHVPWCCMISL